MNVDDVIRERIEAARRRSAAEKERRTRLAAARARGLARRHAQKLRNLAKDSLTLATDNSTPAASGA